jgi:hypothetical protein
MKLDRFCFQFAVEKNCIPDFAALQMSDAGDDELHDLTLHIGHTGKLWEPSKLQPFN